MYTAPSQMLRWQLSCFLYAEGFVYLGSVEQRHTEVHSRIKGFASLRLLVVVVTPE